MTPAGAEPARPSWREGFTVYLKPRVLIVLFLGFSSGLPLALSGSTLQAWMTKSDIDIRTIGLFAAVGIPYSIKFLWAPLIDTFDVPLMTRWLGRRRGWLLFTQLWLMAAIIFLGFCDPARLPLIAFGALLVATASATQDIVIDAFRVESLDESEQAAGMASYVAAYRVGMLVSGAGALVLADRLQAAGYRVDAAWGSAYFVMAGLIVIGIVTTFLSWEPEISATAKATHAAHAHDNPARRAIEAAIDAFTDFLGRDMAVIVLVFITLFKLADALAGSMSTAFFLKTGFSPSEIAAISKGVGFAAMLTGGFAGGFFARAYPLDRSLWAGGLLQAITILVFSAQALIGHDVLALTFAVAIWNFADAFGTVIFVAYQSALCRNPLHTATQFALLTALSSVSRNFLSASAGYLVNSAGWFWFFILCTILAAPGLLLLAWLQHRGHFATLAPAKPKK